MPLSGCREIEELLFDYLEGNLDNRIKSSVEAHLASCESCRTELERCRSTLELLKSAKAAPPQGFASSVLAKIEAKRVGESVPETPSDSKKDESVKVLAPKRPFRFRYGTIAAAVLLIVAIASVWRVLPALMNANLSKSNSVQQYSGLSLASGAAETEAAQQLYGDDAAAGEATEADETERMLMFAAPSLKADEAEKANEETSLPADNSTGTGDNPEGASDDSASAGDNSSQRSLTRGFTATAITNEQYYIQQYAPAFEGLATEVALIHTAAPIHERPYSSARIDGDGYTAFLINDSPAAVSTAEELAKSLGAEIYGSAGSGIVWIEIYG